MIKLIKRARESEVVIYKCDSHVSCEQSYLITRFVTMPNCPPQIEALLFFATWTPLIPYSSNCLFLFYFLFIKKKKKRVTEEELAGETEQAAPEH